MDFLHNGALVVFCKEPIPAKPEFSVCIRRGVPAVVKGTAGGTEALCTEEKNFLVSPGWILDHPSLSTLAYRINLLLSTAERPVAMARIPYWEGEGGDSVESRALRGGILMLFSSRTQERGNILRLMYVDAETLTQAEVASKSRRAKPDSRDAGCVIEPTLVAELNNREHNVDNFEGLALVALPDLNIRVYILSDDKLKTNFEPEQRTLVLSFVLDLRDLSTILPPPRCIGYSEAAVDSYLHLNPVDHKPCPLTREGEGMVSGIIVGMVVVVIAEILGVAVWKLLVIRRKRMEENGDIGWAKLVQPYYNFTWLQRNPAENPFSSGIKPASLPHDL